MRLQQQMQYREVPMLARFISASKGGKLFIFIKLKKNPFYNKILLNGDDSTLICPCDKHCGCGKECLNKLIHRNVNQLFIKKTERTGYGVFTKIETPAGYFQFYSKIPRIFSKVGWLEATSRDKSSRWAPKEHSVWSVITWSLSIRWPASMDLVNQKKF